MSGVTLGPSDAVALQECIAAGGVAVIPTDTVYGIACDPTCLPALRRIYEMKGRPPAKPAAVMYFSIAAAAEELQALQPRTRDAALALLPGPVTLLLANPHRRFPLACEPAGTAFAAAGTMPETAGAAPGSAGAAQSSPPAPLGLRVPDWPESLAPLGLVRAPVLQSSANLSGDPPPRRIEDVPAAIREPADLLVDGGKLPGIASTVIDLSEFEHSGAWRILREGALEERAISGRLAAVRPRC